ncbi:MAG: GvpL/GvpF family gas vesicle protein [Methanoregula sp.]|nr:GvpL/GvpF family gas vesicle protein [Methanoregula sp.]
MTGTEKDGLYLYALVEYCGEISTGITGVDGQQVFSLPYRDLSAIVHACPLTPYASDDQTVVTGWVLTHEQVLERLIGAGMNTIPFTFDTIIKPEKERDARTVLTGWLSKEYEHFFQKFEKIRGRKEYGIQVFTNRQKIRDMISSTNDMIKQLEEEAKTSGPGKKYMIQQKLEKEVKVAMDAEIAGIISETKRKIQGYCDELFLGKLKKGQVPARDMILNCSCLVSDENYPKLGAVLEEIEREGDLSVRFTGPWAVYSFV